MAWGMSDPDFQRSVMDDSQRCLELIETLQRTGDELLAEGDASVNLIPLRELLESVQGLSAVEGVAVSQGDGGGDSAAVPAGDAGGAPSAPAVAVAPAGAGPLLSRQDAVRSLKEVGSFLRKTEPHSPVSFLIERCVRWLNMGFEEVMQDLVKTEDGLATMRETLGLQRQDDE